MLLVKYSMLKADAFNFLKRFKNETGRTGFSFWEVHLPVFSHNSTSNTIVAWQINIICYKMFQTTIKSNSLHMRWKRDMWTCDENLSWINSGFSHTQSQRQGSTSWPTRRHHILWQCKQGRGKPFCWITNHF